MSYDTKEYVCKIRGVTPLIMHNSACADPQNQWAKEMKPYKDKKSKKTERDAEIIADLSFASCLYWSADLNGLYMPVDNVRKMILEAGRACDSKGAKRQVVGIRFDEYLGFPLITKNRDNIEALKSDPNLRYFKIVTINRSKVPSIRAIFKEWAFEAKLLIDTSIVNIDTVETWLNYAGNRIGLGCRRPYAPTPGEFGRFIVDSFKEV